MGKKGVIALVMLVCAIMVAFGGGQSEARSIQRFRPSVPEKEQHVEPVQDGDWYVYESRGVTVRISAEQYKLGVRADFLPLTAPEESRAVTSFPLVIAAIGQGDLANLQSLARSTFRPLANIDIWFADENGNRLPVEESPHPGPFAEILVQERINTQWGLLCEMAPDALVYERALTELGFVKPFRFSDPSFNGKPVTHAVQVYRWREDDLMVYVGD